MTTESDGSARSTAKRVASQAAGIAGSAARTTRGIIRRNPTANRVYRAGVGVVGGGTVALGVALIPLPGPGALIAVGGLAVLASEFEGAKQASTKANAAAKKGVAIAKELRAKRQAKQAAKAAPEH
ncbi:PGPGW domain-containing protein [Plantibacter sp. CFBP 8798]|uniref:PGPGW domain-containing protein n=1 Tax=Plantibacter sp. CFBP 8798 TaxID=2775268 RepID=UPI001781E954|nr:PGPGW domain-containing protein [Plantibacter sp. CFBP 8798]MBD8467674.1 PGPGW domain-containing protein [Plantibacter sp. CFBP 8798]